MRHSAGKNTRLRRQVSQLRHTVTTLRISKVASNDSGGEHTARANISVGFGGRELQDAVEYGGNNPRVPEHGHGV